MRQTPGRPVDAIVTPVAGFSPETISIWTSEQLAPGSTVVSDGLASFHLVTTAACSHEAIVTGGKHPNDVPQLRWIHTVPGNLKPSISGIFQDLNSDQ